MPYKYFIGFSSFQKEEKKEEEKKEEKKVEKKAEKKEEKKEEIIKKDKKVKYCCPVRYYLTNL